MQSARARAWVGLAAALGTAAGMMLTPAHAQTPDVVRLVKCPAIREDAARLACFDTAMNPPTKGLDPNAIVDTSPTAAPQSSADTTRVVQADDVFVTPNKYVGKLIEIPRMKCLYADKGEYRCLGSGNFTFAVFVKALAPQSQRDAIERDCGELSQVMSSLLCLKTVRFTPAKVVNDIVSGFQQRVVLQADAAELYDTKPAARPVSTRR